MPSELSDVHATTSMSPGLALLDRDVNHPVVAGLRQHGHRAARDLRAGPDRPHVGLHEPDPAHRLVDGRRRRAAQRRACLGVGRAESCGRRRAFMPSTSSASGNNR